MTSAVDLTMRNTRRYGGYIVHMGMVLIFVGLSGAAFNKDVQKEMQPGSTMTIGRYTLLLQSMDTKPEPNYTSERLIVEVMKDSKPLMMLYPERRYSLQIRNQEQWWRFTRHCARTFTWSTPEEVPTTKCRSFTPI